MTIAAANTARNFPGIAFQLPDGGMSEEQFYRFCLLNPDLRIERTWDKFIVIMPPTNSETGNLHFELSTELGIWNRQHQLGKGFDSSTGFKLPNGAERSPDLAWIRRERWEALPAADRRKFAPIVPDFVAEIRSPDQNLSGLKEKMEVRRKQQIQFIMTQTNYDEIEATQKLEEFNNDTMKVVSEYLGIAPKKDKNANKTKNQKVFSVIRDIMDSGSRNFIVQQERAKKIEEVKKAMEKRNQQNESLKNEQNVKIIKDKID
jgi:Uma2 family endonuclease